MKAILLIFGLYLTVMGGLMILRPSLVQRFLGLWLRGGTLHRPMALVSLGPGVLLLLAAPVSRMPLLIQVLGWLSIVEGFYLLLMPADRMVERLTWWLGLPGRSYMPWGMLMLVLGAGVLGTL